MTKFVPHTEPDFDTTADGLSVAFRDRGASTMLWSLRKRTLSPG